MSKSTAESKICFILLKCSYTYLCTTSCSVFGGWQDENRCVTFQIYPVTKHISPEKPAQFAMSLLWLLAMTAAETRLLGLIQSLWKLMEKFTHFQRSSERVVCSYVVWIIFSSITLEADNHQDMHCFFGCTRRLQCFGIYLINHSSAGEGMKGRTEGNTRWKKWSEMKNFFRIAIGISFCTWRQMITQFLPLHFCWRIPFKAPLTSQKRDASQEKARTSTTGKSQDQHEQEKGENEQD